MKFRDKMEKKYFNNKTGDYYYEKDFIYSTIIVNRIDYLCSASNASVAGWITHKFCGG
jgi:hypothetical protein